jgi:hypothetical protein
VDPDSAREYRDRWQAVAAVRALEHKALTMADRLRQTDDLMAFAAEAHLDVSRRLAEEAQARRRWEKLKGLDTA